MAAKQLTLSAFIKRLQKLEAAGHGRAKVGVDRESLWDGNGTFTICEITGAKFELVESPPETRERGFFRSKAVFANLVDGDGFMETDSKGRERYIQTIVLDGRFPQQFGTKEAASA